MTSDYRHIAERRQQPQPRERSPTLFVLMGIAYGLIFWFAMVGQSACL